MTRGVETLAFDRLYDNFGDTIDADARAVVRRSADRYVGLGPRRLRPPHLTGERARARDSFDAVQEIDEGGAVARRVGVSAGASGEILTP